MRRYNDGSQQESTIKQTNLIHKALDHFGYFCLPEIVSPPDSSGLVQVKKTLQKPALINFDSCTKVTKPESIVDFVIKKGSQELLVGIWPNGYSLTEEQQQKIESAKRSYVAVLGEWLDRSNIEEALKTGCISAEQNELGSISIQTSYWVYHARHGWYYDREENKVRS